MVELFVLNWHIQLYQAFLPDCDSWDGNCDAYWEDITPDSDIKWNSYVSIPLPENSAVTGEENCGAGSVIEMDCSRPYNIFTPSMKAIPYMRTAPNGDLYMIRNATSSQKVCTIGSNDITGFGGCDFETERQVCPSGTEIPQLWMLKKDCGTASECAANGWTMVAENGSTGRTDMGGNNSTVGEHNTHLALLEFVGDYMYIGFDNDDPDEGANIWRVDMSSIDSGDTPSEGDFSMVNVPGLDGETTNQKLFSHITVNESGTDWLIMTTRDGTNSVQIYRTNNDQN